MLALIELAVLALAAPRPVQQQPPPACSSLEYAQFDFWVGKWLVVDRGTGGPAGTSVIEKIHDGCALRESYSAPGFKGESLNSYSRADGKWHQMWMDSTGAVRHFVGQVNPTGQMVLVAEQPIPNQRDRTRLIRMTFMRNAGDTVRQYSDYSDDHGQSWKLRYDYLYSRATRQLDSQF